MTTEAASRPLDGLRVIDLTDPLGAYAARLLADLGADVLRVEVPAGDACRRVGPFASPAGRGPVSLFERFVNAGKRSLTLDVEAPEAAEILQQLLESADVLLESDHARLEAAGWTDEALEDSNPRLVRTVITPFGRDVAPSAQEVDDLLILATGGLLHLGGYEDDGPVAPHGHQSRFAASTYAAVATLAALIEGQETDRGGAIDVSAQEAIAQALETSVPEFVLTGEVRGPLGDTAREAGTGTYRCADGWVSIVAGRLGTTRAWKSLVEWLSKSGSPGGRELLAAEWSDFSYRQTPEAISRFETIFERFAADHTREELYQEAQARGIALCPVNDMTSVLQDRQLRSRSFYVELDDPLLERPLTYPGLPYRLHGSGLAAPEPAPLVGSANRDVYLDELGMSPDELDALLERRVM